MKKVILLVLCILTALCFYGCGNSTDNSVSNGVENDKEKETNKEEKEDNDFVKMYDSESQIPVIESYFPNAKINQIANKKDGSLYSMRVNGYTIEEYDSYVEACINMGWDSEYSGTCGDEGQWKINYMYTSDGEYYLQVVMVNEKSVDIISEKVIKK